MDHAQQATPEEARKAWTPPAVIMMRMADAEVGTNANPDATDTES